MLIKSLQIISNYLPNTIVRPIAKLNINKLLNRYATINVDGYENLKDVVRPIIFICNHLSNADALVLNKVLSNENVTFVSGVKLSNNSYTKLGTIAINTTPIVPDSADISGLKKIIKLLKDGTNILMFPEGTRSRNGKMIEGKKGVIMIKNLTKASIVPIGLAGTEKLLPINENNMAKEKFQHAIINVKIGKPIQFLDKDAKESKKEYEAKILNILMTNIANLLPAEYRGIYSEVLKE